MRSAPTASEWFKLPDWKSDEATAIRWGETSRLPRFDLEFNERLTFLTGINGSGKTSVLNSVVAMLSPSLGVLAEMSYEEIQITFETENRKAKITATSSETGVTLRYSRSKDRLIYNRYISDFPGYYSAREREAENEYYRAILSTNANHSVIKSISSLPTPMFLGLDRRAPLDEDVILRPYARSRFARNIFSSSLSASMSDAVALAESRYSDVVKSLNRLEAQSRRDVLLRSITLKSSAELEDIFLPTKNALKKISEIKQNLKSLPKILGLTENEVNGALSPTISLLDSIAPKLPTSNGEPDQILRLVSNNNSKNLDAELLGRIASWSVNYRQFSRVEFISDILVKYNDEAKRIREEADIYIRIINRFLNDSSKRLSYDDSGHIQFLTTDGTPVRSLSSGEAQIFVIITQLCYNKAARKANVFIIDEPELSLHIEWQEILVDSVLEANSTSQIILASHSPSIILERLQDCVDVHPIERSN